MKLVTLDKLTFVDLKQLNCQNYTYTGAVSDYSLGTALSFLDLVLAMVYWDACNIFISLVV